jgi:CheY-like chemotaxis protein
VVDDDADARDLIGVIMTGLGARVGFAASAAEAGEAVARSVPDLLVCDVGLLDESGLELLPRLRLLSARAAAMPAIAVTAYAGSEHRRRALAAGFLEHVAKPVTEGRLAEAVAEVLRPWHRITAAAPDAMS